MRAVVVEIHPGRRLALHEVPDVSMGQDEVVVQVRAISLNRGEVKGALEEAADGYRPGVDLSGFVEVAPANSGFKAGDRVVGMKRPPGAWAERVSVAPRFLVPIPASVSFEQAAALPVAGLTALLALRKRGALSGRRVLITGATGGVGMLAIQLAAKAGADVTALVRTDTQSQSLRELGASTVAVGIAAAAAAGPYDLILDLVGGDMLGKCLGWLASRGVCVLAGNAGGSTTTFDSDRFRMGSGGIFGGTTLYGFFLGEELTQTQPAEALIELVQRVADGSLNPMIGACASWSNIHETAVELLDRQFQGKAVLTID